MADEANTHEGDSPDDGSGEVPVSELEELANLDDTSGGTTGWECVATVAISAAYCPTVACSKSCP